jgi:DNA-binding NarL/FixJ family response regulator
LARRARHEGHREAGDDLAKLTRRQQEVAACVAEGLTNEEIGQRLVLSPGTVANHVEAILRRLDLRSRTQVGVWAVERGLFRSGSEDEA